MRAIYAVVCLVAAVTLHSSALAQKKTWVVDAGGGGDFRTLQEACDKASPGDTIFVKGGTYAGATCAKGVRVLGQSLPQIQGMTVRDLPAGSEFVAKGLYMTGELVLLQNKGRIHLESLLRQGIPVPPFRPGFTISESALVSVARCTVGPGTTGVSIRGSTVYLTETTAYGASATTFVTSTSATPAMSCAGSHVVIAGGIVAGGSGSYDFQRGPTPPAPAIVLNSGELTVAGDSSTRIVAGSVPQYNNFSAPAILTASGKLTVGKTVTLQGTNAGGVGGSVSPTFLTIPTLGGQGAGPGGQLPVDAFGPAGSTSVLYVGMPGGRTPFVLGDIWLDTRTLLFVSSKTIPNTGHLVQNFQVPQKLRSGTTLAFQAVNVNGQTARLSTPLTLILH